MKPHLPMKQSMIALSVLSVLSAISVTSLPAMAQDNKEQQTDTETEKLETIQVTGRSLSYANSTISSEMKRQQTPMTSALSIIDNLPGVLVNEGDPFGSD